MLQSYLDQTRDYLEHHLLPFWASRIEERGFGGFQTNFDRNGHRTEVTEKTLLCQARCLFTLSHALREGYQWDDSHGMLSRAVNFLQTHFLDTERGGYFWIVEEDGTPKDTSKVAYGLSFLIYGFSEYALLTGDPQAQQTACSLFDLLLARATDIRHGGFFEHFTRDFTLEPVRPDRKIHKSLDVHMHLMEAFTTLFELTELPRHRQALQQITDLIFTKMVDQKSGLGIAIFTPDWSPLDNCQLGTLWGADRFDEPGKPPEITSYGHNIELAWLYLHTLDTLGVPRDQGRARVLPIFEHTERHGVDHERGGLYVEGERDGPATETTKEFWQQAEALVGFLDAYEMTGERRYLDAFANIHEFVFKHVINWEQGEWFPLLNEQNEVLWDYMGHNWKICYHTIRSMVEVVKRLERLI